MRSSNVMTVFSRSRYMGNIPGSPIIGMPLETVPPSIWQCVQLSLLPTYFSAYFGVSLNTFMPRRMVSPSGPAGIVDTSGMTHAFAESAVWGGFGGAPKLLELVESERTAARAAAAANPVRTAMGRLMISILRKQTVSRLRAGYFTAFAFPLCSAIRDTR